MAERQVRICLTLLTCTCAYVRVPSQAIWAKLGQLTEERGTVSDKEG